MKTNSRKAFTLVELLVVIAIIGILIGMLLPAVQQVREAARRVTCMNQIRQLALACHNYESTHEHFPPGIGLSWDYGPAGDKDVRFHTSWQWLGQGSLGNAGSFYGWAFYLLPYYEQNNVYDAYSSQWTFWGGGVGINPNDNTLLNEKTISVHVCPSDVDANAQNQGYYDSSPASGDISLSGKSNYVACLGDVGPWDRAKASNQARYGIFAINSKTRFAQITDGSSNVILLGERATRADEDLNGDTNTGLNGTSPAIIKGAIWIGRCNDTPEPSKNGGGYHATLGRGGWNNAFEVNGRLASRNIASSGHPGGAACALGDASTHFLSDNLANNTLRDLCKMGDGDTVAGY